MLKLRKPITFEGTTYAEIDISGIENLTARDLKAIDKISSAGMNPAEMVTKELSLDYAVMAAQYVTRLPLEFFDLMNASDAIALKYEVMKYFFQSE